MATYEEQERAALDDFVLIRCADCGREFFVPVDDEQVLCDECLEKERACAVP